MNKLVAHSGSSRAALLNHVCADCVLLLMLPVLLSHTVKLSQRKQLVDEHGSNWHAWVQVGRRTTNLDEHRPQHQHTVGLITTTPGFHHQHMICQRPCMPRPALAPPPQSTTSTRTRSCTQLCLFTPTPNPGWCGISIVTHTILRIHTHQHTP